MADSTLFPRQVTSLTLTNLKSSMMSLSDFWGMRNLLTRRTSYSIRPLCHAQQIGYKTVMKEE